MAKRVCIECGRHGLLEQVEDVQHTKRGSHGEYVAFGGPHQGIFLSGNLHNVNGSILHDLVEAASDSGVIYTGKFIAQGSSSSVMKLNPFSLFPPNKLRDLVKT